MLMFSPKSTVIVQTFLMNHPVASMAVRRHMPLDVLPECMGPDTSFKACSITPYENVPEVRVSIIPFDDISSNMFCQWKVCQSSTVGEIHIGPSQNAPIINEATWNWSGVQRSTNTVYDSPPRPYFTHTVVACPH